MKTKEKTTRRFSAAQMIVFYYIVAVALSTVLLLLPITHKPNAALPFIDAVFLAISAMTVTGLSTVDISQLLSIPGMFIFAAILQFGGVGIMAFGTMLWLLLGKRIGLRERLLMTTEQNRATVSGIVRLIQMIFFFFVLVELIGAVVLGTYFLQYFPSWQEAFLQGFFASVAATTNAGFDITGSSLVPFENDYFVLSINMVLFMIGSLGFPVLMEIRERFRRENNVKFRFSLFTKITTATFLLLIVAGTIFIYLFEYADKPGLQSLMHSLFYSISSRTGGMAINDINQFSTATHLFLSILMFIGASPSSAGGGIRTTTFAVILLTMYAYANRNMTIKIFNREIHEEDIIKSFVVFSTAMLLCSVGVIALTYLEPTLSLMQIVFEVSSAFGTVGLSLGITPDLSTAGKIVIMTLMFIGKIGIFTFLFFMGGKPNQTSYHYPKERIIIG